MTEQENPGTDVLLFRSAQDVSAGQRTYGWTGPWPPPDRLTIVTGPSGRDSVCETALQEDRLPSIRAMEGWTVENFALNTASRIGDPAPKDAHWFRGAEYLPAVE